ncbi:MAG TPA: biotin attachment protein [Candidatus Avacidaminococcus intestinavium]|uniref:Biotin attachment protein n=1 Tax=Candidatus Avacidaminococcus intestinavium TaxID=2840684 RepID=A0A9D1MPA4_9FIRM|nr:biotin attachment protein [Candidatus Avacidaminococcus intestinavium]
MMTILLVAVAGYFMVVRSSDNAYAGSAVVAQTSTLNGVVVAESLTKVGATVKEGQVLVMVQTFAGNAPAARAGLDGTVTEVLVAPGNNVTAGQVVAKIQPN